MTTHVPPITLEDFNLKAAERRLCVEAREHANSRPRSIDAPSISSTADAS